MDQERPRRLRQTSVLTALRVEVRGIEPAFEHLLQRRSVAIGGGEPGGVAVAALVHEGVAEDALVRETEPQRRRPRRGAQRVALPLVAPISEREGALRGSARAPAE